MTNTVTCIGLDGKEYEIPASELKWRPSAYGTVIKDSRILLSKQMDGCDLPGGGINKGESPEEAVIRETKEETGIDVANPRFVKFVNTSYKATHAGKEYFQSLMFYYKCDFMSSELSMDGFDEYEKEYADMPEWIDLAALKDITVTSTIDWRPFVKLAMDKSK
jgi:ADP-ribose pyrophosphatase YjhB (NUDIX family)